MTNNLAQAYLQQASSDYKSYVLLKKHKEPYSQWLHFLQMTMEKTGKAYMASYGSNIFQLRKSHLAFGRFLLILRRNRIIINELNLSILQLKQHIESLSPIVDKIERLAPALSNGINAEYPWILTNEQYAVPCRYSFDDILCDLERPLGRNMLKLLKRALYNERWHKAFNI